MAQIALKPKPKSQRDKAPKEACISQTNGMVNMKLLFPQMTPMKSQRMEAYYTPNTEKVITSSQAMLFSVNFLRAFRVHTDYLLS